MKQKQRVRQGDVLFTSIAQLPKGTHHRRQDGAVAYGEVTGHAHAVMTAETSEVIEIGNQIYVNVGPRGLAIEGDIARILPDIERIAGDETETPLRRRSARQLIEMFPIAGAIFLHGTIAERTERPVPNREEDRHLPVALMPGNHVISIQVEYAPEAIRNVID